MDNPILSQKPGWLLVLAGVALIGVATAFRDYGIFAMGAAAACFGLGFVLRVRAA